MPVAALAMALISGDSNFDVIFFESSRLCSSETPSSVSENKSYGRMKPPAFFEFKYAAYACAS